MRNILTIAWKETKLYFGTPTAYIVGAVFLSLSGYFFVQSISTPFAEATIRGWIVPSLSVFVLWSPIVTMRLFAEEQKLGTMELLLTAPLRDYEIVIGKFLGSMTILLGTVSLTLYYVLLLFIFADPDPILILTGYFGVILFGAATLSAGLFASSLTNNQIVAAIVSIGALLLLFVADQAAVNFSGVTRQVLTEISITAHFNDFVRGVVDLHHVIYYISFVVFFLFVTIRSIESRRWR